MGKFNSSPDLARSKYIIVASVAAIAMVLGAMSVGAIYKRQVPAGANPILSQVYPLPVSDGGNTSSGAKNNSGPVQITPTFTSQQTIPLAAHQDWGKKALLTDPVNIQVRVGLTQPIVQVNALGINVSVPAATDVLQGVGSVLDGGTGSNTSAATPTDTSGTSQTTGSGSGSGQTPVTPPTDNTPSNDEQASNVSSTSSSSELNLLP